MPGIVTVYASSAPLDQAPIRTWNTSLPYGATSPSEVSTFTPARVPSRNGSPPGPSAMP